MLHRFALVALLALSACVATPERSAPVFYLCEANLWSIRGSADPDGSIWRIDIVLDPQGSRELELFTKRNFGSVVRLKAGDHEIVAVSVGMAVRGGRIQLEPPGDRGRDLLEKLLAPPKAPCGPAV